MRIPTIFVPEKDLEEKIRELVKKPRNTGTDYKNLTSEMIYNQATEITEKLGKLDSISSVYAFEDKKTGMTIRYDPRWGNGETSLRIYIKKGHEKSDLVFDAVWYVFSEESIPRRRKISVMHTPGVWQNSLEQLYVKAQQK